MSRVAVLGAGSWGTALAALLPGIALADTRARAILSHGGTDNRPLARVGYKNVPV